MRDTPLGDVGLGWLEWAPEDLEIDLRNFKECNMSDCFLWFIFVLKFSKVWDHSVFFLKKFEKNGR